MTAIATWNALGVEYCSPVVAINYTTIYTQHENGKIIVWYGENISQNIDKVFLGLKLKRIKKQPKADGWILLGSSLDKFWPQESKELDVSYVDSLGLMRTFNIDEILSDKQKKIIFWQNWQVFWHKIC
jgi:hypothetical protein